MINNKSHIIEKFVKMDKDNPSDAINEIDKLRLREMTNEAIKIWKLITYSFYNAENSSKTPSSLNEKTKLYAIDGLVVADALGIPKQKRRIAIAVFTLYYLTVHYLDDIVEDVKKFNSKFIFNKNYPTREQNRILGMSYILHAMTVLNKILNMNNVFSSKESLIICRKFSESLARQIRYLTVDRKEIYSPKFVRRVKQREVSGEATSFLSVVFLPTLKLDKKQEKHLKKALWYLGSLTQFTDDLRDYRKDKALKNTNLLISMEKFYGNGAKDIFINWYKKEEKSMLLLLKKTGLVMDVDLIKLLPFHPYFTKSYKNKV